MGDVMNKTNYRFIGFALLVAVVMFLYLDGGAMMNGVTNGMIGRPGWMNFNSWGLLITSGTISVLILITFLLFRKNIFRGKN
jgi:hypothetical protein